MWILATSVGLVVEVAAIVLLGRSVTRRDDAWNGGGPRGSPGRG